MNQNLYVLLTIHNRNIMNEKTNIHMDIRDAINAIQIFFPEYDDAKLILRRRLREIVEPRQIIQFMLAPHYSLKAIGRATGGFDHSTVINSIGEVNDRMDTERQFKREIELMVAEFNKSRHLRLFGLHESGEQFLQPETWIPNAPADNIAFAYL